jgi:hypothetical protein
MRFKFFLIFLIGSVQFSHAQGKVENATNNTNSNNASTLFEINTITNSNSALPIIQDTIQLNINDNDSYIETEKIQEIKKVKSKQQKAPSVVIKDKIVTEKKELNTSNLNSLNQSFSAVYDETRMQGNQRNPTPEQQKELNKTLQTIETIDSNSFDYHIMKVKAGNYEVNNYYHLAKANELNASHPELQKQILAYQIITADSTEIKSSLNYQVENQQIAPEFINYGADLLYSSPQNSTLITHSFDDTYSVLFNQLNKKERKDVTVINLDFCQSKEYRELLSKKGYQLNYKGAIDTKFLSDMVSLNPTKKIALSMTLPKDYFLNQTQELEIYGLVFIPSMEEDFTTENQSLWEKGLTKKILVSDTELAKRLSKNYLPLLLELSQLYQSKNQWEKKREVDEWMMKIGKKTNVSDQLKKLKE